MDRTMRLALAGLTLSTSMVANPLRADDSATARFTMTVPLACAAETVSSRSTATEATLIVDERCNGPRGYGLYLEHPADIASIRYDGAAVVPGPNGRTLLAAIPHARDHRSRIEIATGREGGNIFLVLSPNT